MNDNDNDNGLESIKAWGEGLSGGYFGKKMEFHLTNDPTENLQESSTILVTYFSANHTVIENVYVD